MFEMMSTGKNVEPPRRVHAGIVALQAIGLISVLGWGITAWIGSNSSSHPATSYAVVAANDTPALTAASGLTASPGPADSEPAPVSGSVVALTPSAFLVRPIATLAAGEWLDRIDARNDIPRRALAAYAGAALALTEEKPGCHLGWNTLAAIGHIESDDGRHGGAVLSDDGYSSVPIIGPKLDGGAFAGIHDSDGGVWDGDTVWDHAVGPFQFIPQTWRTWGADGNGDGQADPNQMDDAALTAARYLCHAGDLSTVDGWRRAVLSYNHSESYVDDVAKVANSYHS